MLDKYINDYVDKKTIEGLNDNIDRFAKANRKSRIYAEELVANDMGDSTNITNIDPSYSGQSSAKTAPEISLKGMVAGDDSYVQKSTPFTRKSKEVAKMSYKGIAKDDTTTVSNTKVEKKKNKSIKLKYNDKYILFSKM